MFCSIYLSNHNDVLFLWTNSIMNCIQVDLEKAFLDDRAVWYRLEDPKGLRGATTSGKSPALSPRGSLSGPTPGPRRGDFAGQRSVSGEF